MDSQWVVPYLRNLKNQFFLHEVLLVQLTLEDQANSLIEHRSYKGVTSLCNHLR